MFPGTRVARVRISHQRATGVTIGRAGRLLDIDVDREVILCAGVVESPHLLMLSGIGPADHLRRHGIDVSVDLPGVGGNLHDHVQVWRSFGCRPGPPVAPGSNLGEAGGFASVLDQSGVPDVQLSFVPKMTLDPADARPGFTIASAVARPTSRGRISLASADPWQPPVIEPNYLATEHDMNILVAGARLVGSLADSHALSGYRDRGGDDPMPDDLREFCRDTAQTQFHPVGTCRFGNDQDAVVDPELRVRGIDGLRVVDASVMPAVTTGNTAAPVFAIAAKAAAMIGNRTGDGTTMASTVW